MEVVDIAGPRPAAAGLPPLRQLEVKFRAVVLPPSQTHIDPIALAVVQYLQIESLVPGHYLTGVQQAQRRDESVYICSRDFWAKKAAEVQRVSGELRGNRLEVLPRLLNIAVVIVNADGKVKNILRPSANRQLSRYHQVFLLQSPLGLSLLLTHKHYALLSNVEYLGSSYVLDNITKPWADSPDQKPVKEAVETVGDLLMGHAEHMLAFALTILTQIGQWLKDIPAFKWCKDMELAESMDGLLTPFLQVMESPFILSQIGRGIFIQIAQILREMTIPHALMVKCFICKRPYASVTFPRCGHKLCDNCFSTLFDINAVRSASYYLQCPCGQPQPRELFLQDSRWLPLLPADGGAWYCELCKEVKASVLFGKKCCKLRTCASCCKDRDGSEEASNACTFCREPFDQEIRRKKLVCQHCKASHPITDTYSSLCRDRHILCSTCIAFSLAYERCIGCSAPYHKGAGFNLQSRVQVQCYHCLKSKPWELFFFQTECQHPLCKDCRCSAQWKCGMCGIECAEETKLAGNEAIMESRCIQCNIVAKDTKTLRSERLHCGCFLHKDCRHFFFASCQANYLIGCKKMIEIDHSVLKPHFRAVNSQYLNARFLQFPVSCACGHSESVTQGFHDPKQWQCPRCRQSICTHCGKEWTDDKHYWQCIFACAYRKKLRLERRHASPSVVQCPECLEPASVSSQTTVCCGVCNTEYCAKCSVPIELIKRHGPWYHRSQCAYCPEGNPADTHCDRCSNIRPCQRPTNLLLPGQFTPMEFKASR